MPTLNLPLQTNGESPKRFTRARMEPKAFPKSVTPRSTTNPLTRSVVMRPPTRDSASSTSGSSPRSFNRTAAPSPAMPPPMTMTSASLLSIPIELSLTAGCGKEIDGLVAARIFHVVKTFAQEPVPILALGHVMDHRAEDDVVVRVPAVFKEQHLATGLQDACRLAEQFFARTAGGNFVRAEAKTNRVARGIRQRHGKVVRLGSDNA